MHISKVGSDQNVTLGSFGDSSFGDTASGVWRAVKTQVFEVNGKYFIPRFEVPAAMPFVAIIKLCDWVACALGRKCSGWVEQFTQEEICGCVAATQSEPRPLIKVAA